MAEVFGRRHPSLASYHVGLSRARELAGDLDGALAASRAAVLVLRDRFFAVEAKRAVDALADINGRRVTFLRHLELIERVAAGRGRPISKSLLNESFEIGQLARGSRTARSLARMAARFAAKDGELLRLVRQRQHAVDAWQRFEEQIVSALSGLGPKKDFGQGALVALRDRQRVPERDIQRLDGRLLNDFPRYAEVINPVPLSIDLTQAYLKPGEALLSTFFGERRGFVWVITASQSRFIPIEASAEDLLLLGSEIRLGLDPFAGAQLTPQGLPATFPARHAFELFVLLFGGARDLLADIRTLYVVADGALQSLPLSVLLTEKPRAESFGIGDFAGAPWLAKKFGIATLPAETSLRALRGDARISQADKPFLGVGDPILANHPGAKHGAPLSDTIAARGVNGGRAGRTLFRGDLADVAVLKKIPSLPETAEELRLMAKALKAGPDALVLGENATEKNLKTTIDWKRYHTISFATHGLVSGDLQGFSEPALVLTPPLRASTLDDGLLTASEISNLDLDADWVILSACNTAASDDSSGGEGLSGLAQAFIYAGARSMFVSHWAVMSKPTVRLTTEMLQLLKSGNALAKTEAHRQAMLALLEDTENPYYAHPTIWAPFVIVGEGGLVRQ